MHKVGEVSEFIEGVLYARKIGETKIIVTRANGRFYALSNICTHQGFTITPGTTDGANGSVTTDGTTVTYTPAPGFAGIDTFTYTIEDGLSGSDTATVTVTVIANIEAVDDFDATPYETPVTVDVLDNDSGDPSGTLTVVSTSDPANGSATRSNPSAS